MLKTWAPQNFDGMTTATVTIFTERKELNKAQLANIPCPVKLIHCGNDIAYPLAYAQRFHENLRNADVEVSLVSLPDAVHFGCSTHPNE